MAGRGVVRLHVVPARQGGSGVPSMHTVGPRAQGAKTRTPSDGYRLQVDSCQCLVIPFFPPDRWWLAPCIPF